MRVPIVCLLAIACTWATSGCGLEGNAPDARSCGRCHGELHTGHGKLGSNVPTLPEDAVASHTSYDADTQRLIFIEKVRHGGFFGYAGIMPPFSAQALSDDQLADILETLGVVGSTNAEITSESQGPG